MGLLGDHCTWKIIETRIDRSRPKKSRIWKVQKWLSEKKCCAKSLSLSSSFAADHCGNHQDPIIVAEPGWRDCGNRAKKRSEAVPSGNLWLRNP
jgi:hypothetical protein